jgi:branched-chain amino acid transport system substrate-binding protein
MRTKQRTTHRRFGWRLHRKTELYCSMFSVLVMLSLATGVMAASPAPQTIPVGALCSLSGFDSVLGQQAKAGYEIAAEDINRTGGIFVKEYNKKIPLEIVVQDTESSPTKAVGRAEWLYTSRKVVAYVGPTLISACAGTAEKNRVPTIGLAQRVEVHERGFKYFFSSLNKTRDAARIVFDLMESIPADKRPKTVAIFQEQVDYGIEQAEYFRKEALQRGYKVVAFEKYTQLTKDFSPAIMVAKNAGAELLLSCPVAPDAMLMMRQMKELDYNPKGLVVLRGADDLAWGKALGAMGDYVILMGGWYHAVRYPGVDQLNATHQAKFGRPADVLTGPAYASIQVLSAAIEKAGSLDPTKIRDAIAATDMMTVQGNIKFRPDGTLVDPCPAVVQWLGGSQKLVWPREYRETSFAYPIPAWKDR